MKAKKIREADLAEVRRELGRIGGLKGGPARAKKLSARKRKEIARKGGLAARGKSGRPRGGK